MTHDEIKQKAIDYCDSKAEKGRSFNPLTVNDLVKFAESCNESARGLSLREQAAISVLNSLLETTEHSIIECIAIRQAYAETAVLYADALIDALKQDEISVPGIKYLIEKKL